MGVHDKGQIIGPNWVQSRQGTLMAKMMMTRVMMMVMIAMMRTKAVMMMILMAPK